MRRTIGSGAIVVLIAVIVTSAYSQVQRPRVRASRQNTQPAGGQSFGTSSQSGWMDPNMTPQQQAARHQLEFQQRMAEMQRQMAEMQRQAEENRNNTIRRTLNATDEQWPQIEPKLGLIDRLKAEASVSADPSSSGGMNTFQSSGSTGSGTGFAGGWMAGGGTMMDSSGRRQTWSTPSMGGTAGNPSDGQALCEQLLRDVQSPGTSPSDIAQRVAALRKIRARAQEQLAQVHRDLRSVITPAQEPALIVMGYLD